MRRLVFAGPGLALLALGVFLMRVVLHGYTDHAHLDVLHLSVAVVAACAGVLLLVGGLRRRAV